MAAIGGWIGFETHREELARSLYNHAESDDPVDVVADKGREIVQKVLWAHCRADDEVARIEATYSKAFSG